jgi:hypothetical protein
VVPLAAGLALAVGMAPKGGGPAARSIGLALPVGTVPKAGACGRARDRPGARGLPLIGVNYFCRSCCLSGGCYPSASPRCYRRRGSSSRSGPPSRPRHSRCSRCGGQRSRVLCVRGIRREPHARSSGAQDFRYSKLDMLSEMRTLLPKSHQRPLFGQCRREPATSASTRNACSHSSGAKGLHRCHRSKVMQASRRSRS